MNDHARVFVRRSLRWNRIQLGWLLASIAATGFLFLFDSSTAEAAACPVEIFVEPEGDCCGEDVCFPTLQEAFDVAEDGDCIRVAEGAYAAAALAVADAAVRIDGGWEPCFSSLGKEAVSISGGEVEGHAAIAGLTITDGTLQIGGSIPPPCTTLEVTATVTYGSNDVTGLTARIDYPEALSLPGTGGEASVLARVENLTGASGIFSAGDNDGDPLDLFVNVGLVSIPGPIRAGPFAKVEFTCEDGVAPDAEELVCVSDVSDSVGATVPSSCALSFAPIP